MIFSPKNFSKKKGKKVGGKEGREGGRKSNKLEEETEHVRFEDPQANLQSWKIFAILVSQICIAPNSQDQFSVRSHCYSTTSVNMLPHTLFLHKYKHTDYTTGLQARA